VSLEEIRERVESAPRLLVAKANEGGYEHPATVYEEEDGLNTLCYLPGEYSEIWQDALAAAIVDAYEDRARLLAALDSVCNGLAEYELEDGARDMANRAIKVWKRPQY
jgi:hypothetical protein